jgi:hypothetical protein
VHRRTERGEELGEGVVLALRDGKVDGREEAVRGILEGSPEGGTRPFDQHLEERRRHALGAEPARSLDHGGRIAVGPDRE